MGQGVMKEDLDRTDYPQLNMIEIFPLDHEGKKLVCLRDPRNPDSQAIYVNPEALLVLRLFDGAHSLRDMQAEIESQYGQTIPVEDLELLTSQLDEAMLLNSSRYAEHKRKLESEFAAARVREAQHSGLSYPENADELRGWIDGFYEKAGNEGRVANSPGKIRGIVSPHIDFNRGGKSYALAYGELRHTDADVYFIFGTSHYAENDNPFIITEKNFLTPFGEAETDVDIVKRLAAECDWDLFEGEFLHKSEHSIEFQVAFLQHALGEEKSFLIVPILCNSFRRMVSEGISPAEDGKVSTFLRAVSEILSELGDRAFVIAGADMAHVGPKFGDPSRVDKDILNDIAERDRKSLSLTERMDAEGFYRSVEAEKDWRKICGLSPIYTTLKVLNARSGKILDYEQVLEPDTGSVVSFASVGFYD